MARNSTESAFMRKCSWFGAAAVISVTLGLLPACGTNSNDSSSARTDSRDSWQYPLRLGDARARVHEILGNATRTTEVLEEYPMSGVTVWFDSEGRLTKLNFHGEAGALYSGPNSMIGANWIPSDRPVLSGLTSHANEDDFRRLLGSPVREYEAGPSNAKEVRRVWRYGGYLIDALFLVSDRTNEGKTFTKGSLVWFEVSPGR